MNLEPMEPKQERRERPGYYDRHQYRKPASWKDWAWVMVGLAVVTWVYVVFGPAV